MVIREQLGRLETSPFYLTELNVDLEPNLMLPLSVLNQMRRSAIDQLRDKRLCGYRDHAVSLNLPEKICSEPEPVVHAQPQLSVWVGDLESVRVAAEARADLIYAGGDELTAFHWETGFFNEAVTIAHDSGARLIIGVPRINREGERSQWLQYLDNLLLARADGIMVSDLGSLEILLHQTELPLYLNYPLNFFNSCALQLFQANLIKQWTVSPELTLTQITELSRKTSGTLECLVHGPLELMVSEYCPINAVESGSESCGRQCRKASYALRDRLQMDFPIFTDQFCRMHFLNSKDLCLFGDLNKFAKLPLVLRLELKTCNSHEVALITGAYRSALNTIQTGNDLSDSELMIDKFKALSGRGITKGHFFRGVE
jgi:putative protease